MTLPTQVIRLLLACRRAYSDPGLTVERDPVSGCWWVEHAATGHTGADSDSAAGALTRELELAIARQDVDRTSTLRSLSGGPRQCR